MKITKNKIKLGIKELGITYDEATAAWYIASEDYGDVMLAEKTQKKLDKLVKKWKFITNPPKYGKYT